MPVTMTREEIDLLAFLASAPNVRSLARTRSSRLWGSNRRCQGRSTVTEHIRRIRLKIEADPEKPKGITTVRGIGYRFRGPNA